MSGGIGQPDGYEGPWGDLLRSMTWTMANNSTATQLVGTLPTYIGYAITLPETYTISISSDALLDGCSGRMAATFQVAPGNRNSFMEAMAAVSTTVTSGAVALSAVSGGATSIVEAQTLALFSLMSCSSSAEVKQNGILRYFISPFADLGFTGCF